MGLYHQICNWSGKSALRGYALTWSDSTRVNSMLLLRDSEGIFIPLDLESLIYVARHQGNFLFAITRSPDSHPQVVM